MPTKSGTRCTQQERYAKLLETELSRFVKRLRSLGACKIILFVVIQTSLPFVERTAWLYAELAPRVACDILAYTPEEWEIMQERPFVRDALPKGVVLYEKERT